MNKQEELLKLEQEEALLRSRLTDISFRKRDLKDQLWSESTGLEIGDKVSFVDGRETITGILAGKADNYGYPTVRCYKKDGTLGVKLARVYNKESLKKAE